MTYFSAILADTPQAYYRLDESSGLVAHDSSGNGYNATLPASGITYSQTGAIVGDSNTSMLFSSTATLALPYTLNPSTWTALSLEFWTKLSGGWQYVVVTTSNTGSTILYLNGSVYSSGSGDFIGIDTDIYYTGSPLSGDLDEIGLYNYVLTPTQILNHYLAGLNATAFYASNVASTIGGLTQSDQMSQTIGGTETSTATTAPASGTNLYVELLSQGGTSSGTLALPAPTGKGWSIPLQGNTILAGPWLATFTLAKSGTAMSGASLYVRFSRRTMDGVCYPIGTTVLSGQTFSTKVGYTTPSITVKFPYQFVSNETLYVDCFVFNGSTAWASDVFTVYVSNSASAGVAGDGMIVAPQKVLTSAGLTYLCGLPNFQTNTALPISNQAFNLADALDQRSILTLTGEDAPGNVSTPRGTPVILSDSAQGLLYTGNTQSDEMTHPAVGSNPQIEHMHTDHDNHYWFDKDPNVTNYAYWYAGDIVCDFLQKLAVEGVTGQFAIESDYTPATFGQGTLSGTVATTTNTPFVYAPNVATPPITTNTGDLELTRAGTQFTLTESVTSDFSSGTLTNMTASNNELTPSTQSALKVIAIAPTAYTTNLPPANSQAELVLSLCEFTLWNSSHVLGSNEILNYDVWIASSSPAFQMSVDVYCSDGSNIAFQYPTYDTNFPSNLIVDQNKVSANIYTDLSSYAKDQWYTRAISLSSLNGKTVTQINLIIAGASAGTYTVYLKNVYLTSGYTFLSTSATQTQQWPPIITVGGNFLAETAQTSMVSVYNPNTSYRISPAHSISGVGLIQNSTINWTASLPTSGTAPAAYPPGATSPTSVSTPAAGTPAALIYISYDGNTWLLCSNQGALPGLPPGTNVSGLSFYLLEAFAAGSDPSAIPALLQTYISINSAAANPSATSLQTYYGTTAEWNTGTSNGASPNSAGYLTLNSVAPVHTWPPVTNEPTSTSEFYGITNPTFTVDGSDYRTITATGTNNVGEIAEPWIQFEFAGQLQDFTVDFDWKISTYLNYSGFLYRTTGWNYWTFNYGYCLKITGSQIILTRGSNSASATGSGTVTVIATVTSTANHHYTLVVKGDRHTVYLDHSSTAIIDVFDSGIQSGGGFGMLYSPTTASSNSGSAGLANFALLNNTVGYWTSPSINLSSLGTCGYTQIAWSEINQSGQQQATAVVRSSLDSGTTWQLCTNNAEIPGLTPGTSVSALLIQIVLFGIGTAVPILPGLQVTICGSYGTVTGTRISPVLNLSPVTYESSSNAMYNSNTPTGTSIAVATTINAGSSWEAVASGGAGAALSYWTPQPSPTQDLFNVNTLANYTNTNRTGGSTASVLYTTAQSQLSLSGGSSGLYLSNAPTSVGDIEVACCLQQSDTGGLVWHYSNGSNYYELVVQDASSSGGSPNTVQVYKISSNVRTLLGTTSITFTRGTFHILKAVMKGDLINAYWDGQCVISYLDTAPLTSGLAGLRNSGGTSLYYQLWIQPLGTSLSGVGLQTKVTLSTSDPSQMPQLFVLACAVRGPHITQGVQINQMHPLTVPFAAYYSAEMDMLTQADGDSFWYVDKYGECYFQSRYARLGAFPLQTIIDPANASGFLLYKNADGSMLKVTTASDTFRNQQVVTNVTTLITPPVEYKVADGTATSWTLGYPVHSPPIITFITSGQPATVGQQGIDNNRQFYWQPGSNSLSYDSSLPVLPDGTIFSTQYVGQSINNLIINNAASQAVQAALEGNSGIVAEIESALRATTIGMTTAQATVFGNGLLIRNGVSNAVEVLGTTMYGGLKPGTFIPVFAPEFGVWNAQLPIVKITTTALPAATGLPVYQMLVDATNGANQSQWQRVFGIA